MLTYKRLKTLGHFDIASERVASRFDLVADIHQGILQLPRLAVVLQNFQNCGELEDLRLEEWKAVA